MKKITPLIEICSIVIIFIFTLLGMFLPYSLELLLGLSLIGTTFYIIANIIEFKDKKKWSSIPSVILSLTGFILSLIIIINKNLNLYYIITIFNLVNVCFYAVIKLIDINKNKKNHKLVKNIGLGFMSLILAVIAVLAIISDLGYGRTILSSAVEIVLKSSNGGYFDSVEKACEYMELRRNLNDESYKLPSSNYQSNVHIENLYGSEAIYFDNSNNPDGYVLYIHGGAYVNQMSNYHVSYCDKLAKLTNYTVIAPLYPLAPEHKYEETYTLINKIYDDLLEKNKPIVIMGDSAGGGFSIAYCEYLNKNGKRLPTKAVLLSPWVDCSMSNKEYDNYPDPMLGVIGLKRMGEAWAGDTDIKDYRISPLFGDVTNFPKTLMFVGTREIFNPDVRLFQNKLINAGVDSTLEIGKGMNHVYPVYPVLEARMALNKIAEFVTK